MGHFLHLTTHFLHSFALIFCHPEFISGSILLTKPILAQCKKVQGSAIYFYLQIEIPQIINEIGIIINFSLII
nr:MAG TPA: hypothetical protein [Caudoviricetes sp.]